MPSKIVLIILLFLNISFAEGKSPNTDNEYIFGPLGWYFKLPANWVIQKEPEIIALTEKYKSELALDDELVKSLKDGKLFFLKTNTGFNRFTSELHLFPGSESEFEIHRDGLFAQTLSQLKGISPTTELKVGDSAKISLSNKTFKKYIVHYKFETKANYYFETAIYVGKFNNRVLTISYSCIEGDEQCSVVSERIESSTFKNSET